MSWRAGFLLTEYAEDFLPNLYGCFAPLSGQSRLINEFPDWAPSEVYDWLLFGLIIGFLQSWLWESSLPTHKRPSTEGVIGLLFSVQYLALQLVHIYFFASLTRSRRAANQSWAKPVSYQNRKSRPTASIFYFKANHLITTGNPVIHLESKLIVILICIKHLDARTH